MSDAVDQFNDRYTAKPVGKMKGDVSLGSKVKAPAKQEVLAPSPVFVVKTIWCENALHVREREGERHDMYRTRWLTLSSAGNNPQLIVSQLVDAGPRSLELLTLEPVGEGGEFAVIGEIDVNGQWMIVSKKARVDYCRPTERGRYEVGLSITAAVDSDDH